MRTTVKDLLYKDQDIERSDCICRAAAVGRRRSGHSAQRIRHPARTRLFSLFLKWTQNDGQSIEDVLLMKIKQNLFGNMYINQALFRYWVHTRAWLPSHLLNCLWSALERQDWFSVCSSHQTSNHSTHHWSHKKPSLFQQRPIKARIIRTLLSADGRQSDRACK